MKFKKFTIFVIFAFFAVGCFALQPNYGQIVDSFLRDFNGTLIWGLTAEVSDNKAVYPLRVDNEGHTQGDILTIEAQKLDDHPFTVQVDPLFPVGFIFDDVAPDSVTEGNIGILRMSTNRNLYTNIRDAAGNERGLNINARSEGEVICNTQSGIELTCESISNANLRSVLYVGGQISSINSAAELEIIVNTQNSIELSCEALSYPNLRIGIWDGNQLTDVNSFGQLEIQAFGINNVALTTESISDANIRSALYAGSQRADINSSGQLEIQAFGINNVALTTESLSVGNLRVGLWDGAQLADINSLGQLEVQLFGVADAALSTESVSNPNLRVGIWDGLQLTDVNGFGQLEIQAFGRNDVAFTTESVTDANIRAGLYAGSQRADINSNGHLEVQLFADNNVSLTTESIANKNLRISLYNGTSIWRFDDTDKGAVSLYGKSVAAGDMPVLVDGAGNLQVDIVSATNNKLLFSVEAYSATNDQFKVNANLQVGDSDNSISNPAFVTNSTNRDMTVESYQGGSWSVTATVDINGQTLEVFNSTTKDFTAEVSNNGTFVVQAASTIADGADVTQGAKADAKSTATDTTAISIMQVLKQISYMEQTPASRAVTNAGTFAVTETAPLTGFATSALQLPDGHNVTVDNVSIPVTGTFWQTTQPISVATIPSHAVTNAGTFAVQAACTGTFYQATQPVSIATMPSTPVTGTFYQALQPVTSKSATKFTVEVSAILAGDNNIGNVDIVTLPTLANVTTVATVTNLAQQGGVAISLNTGVRDTGTQRVTIATNDIVPTSQSGIWTVQPGNTPNMTPWLVDGSSVTQPISGAVTNVALSVVGAGSELTAQRVTIANDSTGLLSVDDNGGSLTVDGAFYQVTQPVSIATAPVLVAGTALIGKVGIDQTTPGTTNGVQVNAALPAGTNNIGDVDVLTLPALVAGTANIGDVDVLTMPNVETGTSAMYNLALTNANTEYSQAITNAKSITFQNRSESDIRYSDTPGKVATSYPYWTVKAGTSYNIPGSNFASKALYFAHSIGGVTVEIIVGQ